MLIPTGWKFKLPPGTYGRIAPRSGLSLKGIDVGAGVIDRDYRGEIKVLLINNSAQPFAVNKGDRIAQLICEKIVYPYIKEDILDYTTRGDKGFGSTGLTLSEPQS